MTEPRYILQAIDPETRIAGGETLEVHGEHLVVVTVPEDTSLQTYEDVRDAVAETSELPVIVISEGLKVEVMKVVEVPTSWERIAQDSEGPV